MQLRGRDSRVGRGLPDPRLGDPQFLPMQQEATLALLAVPLRGTGAQIGVLVSPVEVIVQRLGHRGDGRPGSPPGSAGIQFSLDTRGCRADCPRTSRSRTGMMSLLRAAARSSSGGSPPTPWTQG